MVSRLLKNTTVQDVVDIICHKDIKSTMASKKYALNKKEIQKLWNKIDSDNLLISVAHSKAPTAKFGSPLKDAASTHAKITAHNAGYLITDGVQFITTLLTPATKA